MSGNNVEQPFNPLRIRAYLVTPVISDEYLPLDGVLYYHQVRSQYGARDVTYPNQSDVCEGGDVSLPILKTHTDSDMWFYASSFAQWPDHTVQDKQFFSKVFNQKRQHYLTGKQKTVMNKSGAYKGYRIPVYTFSAQFVDWYVCGNRDQIELLLSHCHFIGKKSVQGYGQVREWQIDPWPEDWSVRGPQNKLMRNVPLDQSKPGFLYGIRPSYWHPKHQFITKMPQ